MTRYMLLVVLMVLGSVELAQAQPAGFGMPPAHPGYPTVDNSASGRYGFAPFLRKCFWWKGGDLGCSTCGSATAAPPPPGIGYPGTPGYQMPGTLVFPNHPFMRSPRDFFMYEPGK